MARIVQSSNEARFRPEIECLDDDTAYSAFSQKFSNSGMKAGVAVPSEIVPRKFRATLRHGRPNGFFSCLLATAVDDRVKEVIEAHEPNVHRFHPIEIVTADGTPFERPHFFLNCCTKVDAIDPETSKVKVRSVVDPEKYPDLWHYVPPGLLEPLAVFKERIAGRAMWWDERLNHLFFSDAVVDELVAAGVEGIRLSPRVSEL